MVTPDHGVPSYTHQIFWERFMTKLLQGLLKRRRVVMPMSDFETGMRYVRATLGFEGLVLTEEEEKLLERRFHEEITEEEYMQKALELSYSGD